MSGEGVVVAFAVPRRVGTAVLRNRVRRRLRAAVREIGAQVPEGRYVIGADGRAATTPFPVLVDTLRSLMNAEGNNR